MSILMRQEKRQRKILESEKLKFEFFMFRIFSFKIQIYSFLYQFKWMIMFWKGKGKIHPPPLCHIFLCVWEKSSERKILQFVPTCRTFSGFTKISKGDSWKLIMSNDECLKLCVKGFFFILIKTQFFPIFRDYEAM